MKYILILFSMFIPIESFGKTTLTYGQLKLSGSYFTPVFQIDLNILIPKWMEFVDGRIKIVTSDKARYLLNYKQSSFLKSSGVKIIPQQVKSITDHYGNVYELEKGEVDCTIKDELSYVRPIEIIARPSWQITLLEQDYENGVVYLIAGAPNDNYSNGTLFSIKTSRNFSEKSKPIFAEESNINNVIYMTVDQKQGDLAFAINHIAYWEIVIFKREIDDGPRSTEISTTSTTEKTTLACNDLMISNNKLIGSLKNIRQHILGKLTKLQILYERDRNYCQNTEKKYVNLLKRYIRTLELTEPEEIEMRKNYIPDIKLKSFEDHIRKLIDTSIINLHQTLLDVLEDTPESIVNIEDA